MKRVCGNGGLFVDPRAQKIQCTMTTLSKRKREEEPNPTQHLPKPVVRVISQSLK
jgi:hypothetical protein